MILLHSLSVSSYLFVPMSSFYMIFSICATFIFQTRPNTKKKNRFVNWLSMHSSKQVLFTVIFILGLSSLERNVIWTLDELKDVISLEWSIFSISITIFLVWNVLILDYLKRKKPQCPYDSFPTYTWRYIQNKGKFYEKASSLFSSVSLLTVNLISLIVATAMTYISNTGITIWNQNVSIFSFFLCTNTIISLFLDILKPLNEEKSSMLQETKVTGKDIDLQNEIDSQISRTLMLLEEVDKLNNIPCLCRRRSM